MTTSSHQPILVRVLVASNGERAAPYATIHLDPAKALTFAAELSFFLARWDVRAQEPAAPPGATET